MKYLIFTVLILSANLTSAHVLPPLPPAPTEELLRCEDSLSDHYITIIRHFERRREGEIKYFYRPGEVFSLDESISAKIEYKGASMIVSSRFLADITFAAGDSFLIELSGRDWDCQASTF